MVLATLITVNKRFLPAPLRYWRPLTLTWFCCPIFLCDAHWIFSHICYLFSGRYSKWCQLLRLALNYRVSNVILFTTPSKNMRFKRNKIYQISWNFLLNLTFPIKSYIFLKKVMLRSFLIRFCENCCITINLGRLRLMKTTFVREINL